MKIEILVNTIIALILVVLILTRKVEQKKKIICNSTKSHISSNMFKLNYIDFYINLQIQDIYR